MPGWRAHWPVLAVAVGCLGYCVRLAELDDDKSNPRTFSFALAAVLLGAWLGQVLSDRDGRSDGPRDGTDQ